jgi:23S rRNA (uracil1939-C5)-methyltransferase
MSEAGMLYEVEIQTLVYGGDGLGRLPDGRAVFVPFCLPGERVRVRVIEEKPRHARAELVEVLSPSPQRIQPRCLHFGICGGCQYQHLSYEDQVLVKTAIVREQLQRIGGIADPPVKPAIPSPAPYYYRNNMQLHLTFDGKLGYYEARVLRVFGISECHLPEPDLNEVWPHLEMENFPGLERIELRLNAAGDALLVLESSQPEELPEMDLDMPLSVVHLSPVGPIVMAGDDHIVMQVLGRPFYLSAGSFFQVNTSQAEAIVQYLLDHLPLTPDTVLMDVYCGVGLFSAFLAPHVGRLIGIESSPFASQDFAVNLDEFDHVELYEGAAEEVLPQLNVRPDIIIVDPPRAGLLPKALDALVNLQPALLAYVSCDPATLARDLKRLRRSGYELASVQPFDMFPQTAHVETVVLMSRLEK